MLHLLLRPPAPLPHADTPDADAPSGGTGTPAPGTPAPPTPAPSTSAPERIGSDVPGSGASPAPGEAGADGDPSGVVTRLLAAFLRAARVTRGLGEQVNRITGIRRNDYLTLIRVQEHDRSRISDLAAGLELDVSVVSRKVASLQDLGLVVREPDPDDGRAQVVSVTELGRETITTNRRIYTEALGRMTADWERSDLDVLAELLERLGEEPLPDLGFAIGAPADAPGGGRG